MAQTDTSALRYASDPDPDQQEQLASRLTLSPPNCDLPMEQRGREVLRLAQEAFAKTGNWVVFYREMLGTDGVVRKLYANPDEMRAFEDSREFAELQEMVAAMRSQDASKGDATEPERMITIRLAKVVLQVANKRIVPVDDVQRTIRSDLQINRTEVSVRAFDKFLDFFASKS